MDDINIKIEGNQLTITATISSGVPSSSGKTLVVCSSNGFIPIPGSDLKLSINVIKPRK